ncbi:hypothetical protein [Paenibacillus phytorum]|nr:hypothetical protein [Paenibacillus phytorum]
MYNLFFLDYELSITPVKTKIKYQFMIFVIYIEMIPISIITDKVVLKADEGGVWGDPFESLTIDRGSVVVSEYGGSKENADEDDYNLLTGEYITRRTDDQGNLKITKGKDFNLNDM